jgi:hypothetical protein
MRTKTISVVLFAIGLVLAAPAIPAASSQAAAQTLYAPDFVSAAAFGAAMNDVGDIVGTSYLDTGCGPFCLPPLETVVWKAGVRTVLPAVPRFTGISVTGINNSGWICGSAGPFGFTDAVVWKPNGTTYTAIDLGVLPGTAHSVAIGIDDSNRVVGYAITTSGLQTPFVWTEAGGMVDLSAQGFPAEIPLGISRSGLVATIGFWYRLGDPASVTAVATPPSGLLLQNSTVAINDAGDQARFLVAVSGENLVYPFRYHHEGTWQQLSTIGTGHLSSYGIGSINAAQDITLTALSTAMIAYGPDGLAQSFTGLLSSAYNGTVTAGGPLNASGQILAQVMVGLEPRLMRLSPASACSSSCMKVNTLVLKTKFHQDPGDPGHCTSGNTKEYNLARATVTVTSETGARLAGVLVNGRFMDEYWTNSTVSGTTNSKGAVQFTFKGPCGIGAETFMIENLTLSPLTFDKTVGVLSGYQIPSF